LMGWCRATNFPCSSAAAQGWLAHHQDASRVLDGEDLRKIPLVLAPGARADPVPTPWNQPYPKVLIVDGRVGFTGGINIREACILSTSARTRRAMNARSLACKSLPRTARRKVDHGESSGAQQDGWQQGIPPGLTASIVADAM